MKLKNHDRQIERLIKQEQQRQAYTLMMIPSENYASKAVREALGSVLTNKYSEGYPGRRYYQGNKIVDQIEQMAIDRARKLFKVPYANVQPYSGSPANAAIYFALLNQGDKIMGLRLAGGGHLTHGHPKVTFSGKYFTSVQYDVEPNGWIDIEKAAKLAKKEKPKIIIVGTTAYPRILDWQKWGRIADSIGAWLMADISHIAGLIVGGVYPSPVNYAHIVMTTTHKTLRGPRGAVILVTQKGLDKDPDLGKKIDRAVFPGLQGGPHDNVTAAIAVCLKEAESKKFKQYARQIVKNAQTLAETLIDKGLTLVTDGTDSHLLLIDLRPQKLIGNIVAEALEVAGIVVNKNTVPHDPNPPMYPSGIRLGTPALTTRGMKQAEMKLIGEWIADVVNEVKLYRLPRNDRSQYVLQIKKELLKNHKHLQIAHQVKQLCSRFPVL